MEPVAIVTAFVAALYVVGRGGFVIAPRATAEFYRRTVYATDGRMRAFGGVLLVLVAVPLIVTARQASPAHGDILIVLQVLGWLATAAAVWVLAAPRLLRRLADKKFLTAPDAVLRSVGALSVAFGLYLGWAALFVL